MLNIFPPLGVNEAAYTKIKKHSNTQRTQRPQEVLKECHEHSFKSSERIGSIIDTHA